MVMDANLLSVIPVPKENFSKPAYIYKIQTKYIIFYFPQVRKIDQICIQIWDLHTFGYIIYDNLGILSDTLKNQNISKCSTLQCIIHLLTDDIEINQKSFISLSKERPILDHHAKTHIHEIWWISPVKSTRFGKTNCQEW